MVLTESQIVTVGRRCENKVSDDRKKEPERDGVRGKGDRERIIERGGD